MAIKISDIEDKIVTAIQNCLTGEGTVETIIGDPLVYLDSKDVRQVPCILIQYISNQSSNNINLFYPGVVEFNIYFIHDDSQPKTNQRVLYDYMSSVVNALSFNNLGYNINHGLIFLGQNFAAYDNDYIVYSQKYQIGVSN